MRNCILLLATLVFSVFESSSSSSTTTIPKTTREMFPTLWVQFEKQVLHEQWYKIPQVMMCFDMRYWWITEWNQIKWANKVSWKRRGAQIRQHQDHRPTGHNIVNWLDTYKKWTVYLRIIPFRKLEKSSCHYRQPDIIVLYDHATLKMLHHDPSNILRRIISL